MGWRVETQVDKGLQSLYHQTKPSMKASSRDVQRYMEYESQYNEHQTNTAIVAEMGVS